MYDDDSKNYCIVKFVKDEAIWTQMWCEISSHSTRETNVKISRVLQMESYNATLRMTWDYVSRPDFISTKKRQSLMEIRPWHIVNNIIFQSLCAIVWKTWSWAQGPSPLMKAKSINVSSLMLNIFYSLKRAHLFRHKLNETTKHELSVREHKRTQEQEETKIKFKNHNSSKKQLFW